jgi:SEC-C motif
MTLIISLLRPAQVILVSDRRFTVAGKVHDDERSKATALFCQDGRAAVAFTGMAGVDKFETSKMLLDALARASKPEHSLLGTINRLPEILSEEIRKLKVRPDKRHLRVVIAGYRYDLHGPPRAVLWQITNSADEKGSIAKEAFDKFRVFAAKNSREDIGVFGQFGFGRTAGIMAKDRDTLRELLLRGAPLSALIDKAVDTIRNAAASPKSGNLVGNQCDSIILPADRTKGALAGYHSAVVRNKMYLPNIVISTPAMSLTNQGGYIEQLDPTQPPLTVPKVGRNEPCPCGSGKKYKKCHGAALRKQRIEN